MLFLMILGAASVKAQVRIGGSGAPNTAAVLDLNADDSATPTANKGALALPRVSLASTTAQLNGAIPITGMLVYNTNSTLGVGVYFWDGVQWVLISGNGVVGNALTDTITGGGLNKTGAGTANNPWKVGIKTVPADSGKFLISNGSTVVFGYGNLGYAGSVDTVALRGIATPVTWSLIVDTIWSGALVPGKYATITIPGLHSADLCVPYGNAYELNYHAGEASVSVQSTTARGGFATVNARFRCYRPSV